MSEPGVEAAFEDPGDPVAGVIKAADHDDGVAARDWQTRQTRDLALQAKKQSALALGQLGATQAQATATAALARQALALAQSAQALASRADEAAWRAQVAQAELRALYQSTSWRLTAPLRGIAHSLRGVPWRVKFLLRAILRRCALWLRGYPAFADAVRKLVGRFPGLQRRLRRMTQAGRPQAPEIPQHLAGLTPYARRIHARLAPFKTTI